jgi:rubredoxin
MAEKVKCDVCNEMFKNAEGLEQHKAAKHSSQRHEHQHHPATKDSKEKSPEIIDKQGGKYLAYGGIGIVVIIALVFYFSSSSSSGSSSGSGTYDTFAQCLTQNGAVMYGAFWCPHCAEQKKLFGASFSQVNYVECSTPDGKSQLPICTSAGIQSYPTWKFADGSTQGGVLSFAQLSAKTGCAVA